MNFNDLLGLYAWREPQKAEATELIRQATKSGDKYVVTVTFRPTKTNGLLEWRCSIPKVSTYVGVSAESVFSLNPNLTWAQAAAEGVSMQVAIDAARLERDAKTETAEHQFRGLLLDERTYLQRVLTGERNYSRRKNCDFADSRARVWALYGTEGAPGAKRGEFETWLKRLPRTAFGLRYVEDARALVDLVNSIDADKPAGMLEVLRSIDRLLASAGAPPITREKPRSPKLRVIWECLKSGAPYPTTKEIADENQ